MIRCQEFNISFVRADTYEINATYQEVLGGFPPVFQAIPLPAGSNIYFTCKWFVNDADPGLFQLSVGSGITITNANAGQFTILIPETATKNLPCNLDYLYDCVIEPLAGGRNTVMRGSLFLEENVTDF